MQETIVLGGREFVLQELPLRPRRKLCDKLKSTFGDVINMIESGPGVQLTDREGITHLLRSASTLLLESVDIAADLLCEFSPVLAEEREFIEDNAVASEIVDAFLTMLTLLYPFLSKARWSTVARNLGQIGSSTAPTSTN